MLLRYQLYWNWFFDKNETTVIVSFFHKRSIIKKNKQANRVKEKVIEECQGDEFRSRNFFQLHKSSLPGYHWIGHTLFLFFASLTNNRCFCRSCSVSVPATLPEKHDGQIVLESTPFPPKATSWNKILTTPSRTTQTMETRIFRKISTYENHFSIGN